MKIDRRAFLSFMAGGAAGTALSPLPWKLIDDFSIWSQAWPWVPVPKDGESTYVNTVCSLCSGGCGITVRKIGNRVVKIEGLKGDAVSDGRICSLGLSGAQLLYGPTRVKGPMIRDGLNTWRDISWSDAISTVVGKLTYLRDNGKANKVACISDSYEGTVSKLFKRFLHSYGSYNFVSMPKNEDVAALTLKSVCGFSGKMAYDFEDVDFALMLGANIASSWDSPVKMIRLLSNWMADDLVEVIHVDSRYSETSTKADQWVSINPGTEADLAFGMASYIISHELYNKGFVDRQGVTFSNLKKVILGNYQLDVVSKNTGISVDIISNLAKSFITANNPVIILKNTDGVVSLAYRDYASLLLLNFLKGTINKKGGINFYSNFAYKDWPDIIFDDIAKSASDFNKSVDNKSSERHEFSRLLDYLMKVHDSDSKPLELLFFLGSNPSYVLPNANIVQKALRRVPFLVSFSSFMDETASISDLILPDHIYLEKYQDIPFFDNDKFSLGISRPVVSPVLNTRHVGNTILDMARLLGGSIAESFPWVRYEECLEFSIGKKISFLKNDKLLIEGNTGLLEINKFDFSAIDFSEVLFHDDFELYPLILIFHDSLRLANGYISSPPFLVKTVDDSVLKKNFSFVDINPQTAIMLGLSEKSYAILSVANADFKVRINYSHNLKPGIVSMVRGLGHTAYDDYIAGKGVNVNNIIKSTKDPVLGHDMFYSIRAKLSKA